MTRNYGQPWNKGRSVGSRRALSASEIAQIRSHLKTHSHDYCLFMVAVDTMLRASDLLNLKVRDLMFSNGSVRQSFPLRQKKTSQSVFPVLTTDTCKAITNWVGESQKREQDYLFTRAKNPHGQPITIGFYRTLIKSWVKTVGIPAQNISAHSLRRSKAIYLYEQGVTVELIGRLLGHRSSVSTIRYLGIDEAQAREAALTHNIFDPKPVSENQAGLAEQLWELLAPKLDEYLTKNGE